MQPKITVCLLFIGICWCFKWFFIRFRSLLLKKTKELKIIWFPFSEIFVWNRQWNVKFYPCLWRGWVILCHSFGRCCCCCRRFFFYCDDIHIKLWMNLYKALIRNGRVFLLIHEWIPVLYNWLLCACVFGRLSDHLFRFRQMSIWVWWIFSIAYRTESLVSHSHPIPLSLPWNWKCNISFLHMQALKSFCTCLFAP